MDNIILPANYTIPVGECL